jgi:hypothetical protein
LFLDHDLGGAKTGYDLICIAVILSQVGPNMTFRKAIEWLNSNRQDIRKKIENGSFQNGFEYPDYFDMPKNIAYRLESGEVDWIQDQIKGKGFWPE